jgi:hypothetical protein
LIAGGGAYYFAKKSINADRAARFEADQKKRRIQESLEYSSNVPTRPGTSSAMGGSAGSSKKASNRAPVNHDTTGSPSQEATADPAPTRHAPHTESQRVVEKSKYETSEPFRARKGDRFSSGILGKE